MMSDRPINLLLIDPDSIYRTGLRVVLEQHSQVRVAAEAADSQAVLQNISALGIDVAIVELRLSDSSVMGWQLCQQIKTQYPNLPILILTCHPEPSQLAAARQAGVEGFCHKGITAEEIIHIIRELAAGRSYWESGVGKRVPGEVSSASEPRSRESEIVGVGLSDLSGSRSTIQTNLPFQWFLIGTRDRLRRSGLQQINGNLAQVTARLQEPGLPTLDRAMLAGQRRELLAARWVVERLLVVGNEEGQGRQGGTRGPRDRSAKPFPKGREWGLGGRRGTRRTDRKLPRSSRLPTPDSRLPTPDSPTTNNHIYFNAGKIRI
ncbi:MAG: Transcriptional regulatory protein RcsB [Chroococcidiopsis sp. SAG 2025]|uniref:response regulator transcription factor n=1 Tax=Chroococcidiopsis sp. SAG 2025 TaxID=171389 RepID=UPI002936F495|nr:response regulator transcription factor [Chroococcidiopsis sp. SAG 2025]MDV2991743.1 Transcriptional regulatory protein RcsB [Chroococcidiopsis sp. SAG 2025]